MSEQIRILWADDEIDTLKPQLIFLKKKGYDVVTVTNGHDAIDELDENEDFDVVFLDESMPGITGLEALERIKQKIPSLPVIMITKNEEEDVMEEALGSQITDYLIKPVNPNQILLALKKITDNKRLIREKTLTSYQQEFRQISMDLTENMNSEEWVGLYKRIIDWELRLDKSDSDSMSEIINMQKKEANREFCKYAAKEYASWVKGESDDSPVMSHNLISKKVLPALKEQPTTVFLLLDNLRYDQLMIIEEIFLREFRKVEESHFYSILPTATQYSRNAIFAGMMPADIERHFPEYWKNDTDEGGKNLHEKELLEAQLDRRLREPIKWDYKKISRIQQAKQVEDNYTNLLQNEFNVIVYNFIDMLSHARTEMEVLKELASDERAYRSITRTWLENSPLWSMLRKLAEHPVQLIVTTDHGTIRVNTPSKVVGDRETTTNLRYKVGRNLKYQKNDVLAYTKPEEVGLPRPNMSSSFIFGKEDTFFLYPNNYNHYHRYYKDTFQHGGLSLEEMVCPFMRYVSKG